MIEYKFRVEMPFCPQSKIHCTKRPYCATCEKEYGSENNSEEKSDKKNRKQLTTRQANNTRNVTKVINIT